MTAHQPPQPPFDGEQPAPGMPPPYGQPAASGQPDDSGQPHDWGQPGPTEPTGFPAPGHGPQPLEWQPPGVAAPFGQPTGTSFSMDPKKLRMADYVLGAGTVLYLILGVLPWVSLGSVFGFNIPGGDISGFSFSGMVSFAFVLFLLATVWAILPALYPLEVGFPRSYVTVGLSALGALLTLFAWIRSLKYEFKVVPLLALLTALVILAFAVLTLLPELRNGAGSSGGLGKAGHWANRGGPEFGRRPASPGQAGAEPVAPPQRYAPPSVPPPHPGGSSAPGAGAPGAGTPPGPAGPV